MNFLTLKTDYNLSMKILVIEDDKELTKLIGSRMKVYTLIETLR